MLNKRILCMHFKLRLITVNCKDSVIKKITIHNPICFNYIFLPLKLKLLLKGVLNLNLFISLLPPTGRRGNRSRTQTDNGQGGIPQCLYCCC